MDTWKWTCEKEGCTDEYVHCHCPECGEPVSTESAYLGAVTCYNCDTYMNTSGQRLRPMSEWEEPLFEDDY